MSLITAFVFLALGGFAIFGILRINDETLMSINAKTRRTPLTDEQVYAIVANHSLNVGNWSKNGASVARAVERAHNIK